MLDLMSVASQLRRMGTGMAALSQETAPRLAQALTAWERAAAMGAALRDRVQRAKTSWLVAEPLEPLGAIDVSTIDRYRVIASDGSQIMPDHHDHLPCFLVNTGLVDISYVDGSVRMSSIPEISWAPDDVYPLFGGIRQAADVRVVGARRFAAECDALAEALSEDSSATDPLLAFVDGTLLLWWLEPEPDRLRGLEPHDVKLTTFDALRGLFDSARNADALVCAYLSAPRTKDVVSMLKVVLCTEDPVDCDRCPYDAGKKLWHAQLEIAGASLLPVPSKPCEEADPLTDASVFRSLLAEGQRSPRFRSAARVTGAYPAPVDFFYLDTGAEIARIEFPGWITPERCDLLAAAVLDQCRKGLGYPVALGEAHEQAVVRAADRRTFMDLARRNGISGPSAKLARKRLSVL